MFLPEPGLFEFWVRNEYSEDTLSQAAHSNVSYDLRVASKRRRLPRVAPGVVSMVASIGILGVYVPITNVGVLHLSNASVLVAFGLTLYSAARIGVLFGLGTASLIDMGFWTFFYSFMILPFLAQDARNLYPLGTSYSYSPATQFASVVVIGLGVVAYETGRLLARRRNSSSATMQPGLVVAFDWSERRALVVAYLGSLISLYAVHKFGLAVFFESRNSLTGSFLGPASEGVKYYLNANKAAGTSLQFAAQVPVFVGTYLAVFARRSASRLKAPKASLMLYIPLVVCNVVVNNPISNARAWYGTVIISFAAVFLPVVTRRWASRLVLVIFIFVSLFSFQQLAAFRNTTYDFTTQPLSVNLVADPDYGSPQQVLNGIEYVSERGFTEGHQILGSLFVWVPRLIWPGKPGDTGQLVGGAAGFKVAAPLWTEGYVDFGVFGVIAFLMLLGVVSGRIDGLYRSRSGDSRWMAFSPLMSSLIVFLLRGSLQPAIGLLIPVIVLFIITTRRSSARTSAAQLFKLR